MHESSRSRIEVMSSNFQMSRMIDDIIGLLCVKWYSYVISLDYMRNFLILAYRFLFVLVCLFPIYDYRIIHENI